MPYLPNIPQPNDRIRDSQADLLGNFQALNTFLNVNHGDFGSAQEGKHKWVTFPNQMADPTTLAAEVAIFSKPGISTGNPSALFLRKENNAAVKTGGFTEFFTNGFLEGWTRLPSGILLKWGFVAPSLPNPATVTFPVNATTPVFTALYSVQVSPSYPGAADNDFAVAVRPGSLLPTSFQVWMSPRTTVGSKAGQLYYLAIGE